MRIIAFLVWVGHPRFKRLQPWVYGLPMAMPVMAFVRSTYAAEVLPTLAYGRGSADLTHAVVFVSIHDWV